VHFSEFVDAVDPILEADHSKAKKLFAFLCSIEDRTFPDPKSNFLIPFAKLESFFSFPRSVDAIDFGRR
jgi:hypothetical protein